MEETSRDCSVCGEPKPLSEFPIYKRGEAGKVYRLRYCRLCRNDKVRDRNRKWQQAHPEVAKEREKRWYAANKARRNEYAMAWKEAHPDKVAESNRRFRKNHPEVVRLENKKYRERHPDKVRERKLSWAANNPGKIIASRKKWLENNKERARELARLWTKRNKEKARLTRAACKAKRRSAEGSFSTQEFKELCQRYGNRCLCCGSFGKLTPDHIVPLSKGGTNFISNIQPLCFPCNMKKGVNIVDYRKIEARGG